MRVSLSGTGLPAWNALPSMRYGITMMRRSETFRKNNSGAVRDHVGSSAAELEICTVPPGPGYGFTKTSSRPPWFERYATQRPSGENIALDSENAALRNAFGTPPLTPFFSSPSIGSIVMSLGAGPMSARMRPLG